MSEATDDPSADDELDTLLSIPTAEAIPMDRVRPYLCRPPWQQIDGAFNLRSVSYSPLVRADLIYRSGMLGFLSENGRHDIVKSLGVSAIFDLRFDEEQTKTPDPNIPGVQIIGADLSRVGKSVSDHSWANVVEMLLIYLEEYRSTFRKMLLFVLNNPGESFLVHCTGGKDRSGIAVALLLSIAKVPREYIAYDFALTRIEIEPVRERLQARVDMNDEKLKAIAGCEASCMVDFLEQIDRKYEDGVEGFANSRLGLTTEELDGIRQSLHARG